MDWKNFTPNREHFTLTTDDWLSSILANGKAMLETLLITAVIVACLLIFYIPLTNFYHKQSNEKALLDIKKVDVTSYETFKAFINHVEDHTDWRVQIVSGYRDKAHQAQLKKKNPKNAKPGKSKHNMGKAIDINVFQANGIFCKRLVKGSSKEDWQESEITQIAKQYNLRWGGDFKNYHDPVHFEID
jgi:hypothetical protein